MNSLEKAHAEIAALKCIVMFLLARDYAVHRQPLEELVWDGLFPKTLRNVSHNLDDPLADQLLSETEREARWLLSMSEKLAKNTWGDPPRLRLPLPMRLYSPRSICTESR
jgi:hypothetical protein